MGANSPLRGSNASLTGAVSSMRKFVYGLILAFAVSALYPPAAAQADTVSDEAAFVVKINELRAGKGLAPLQVNANLVEKARAWSAGMRSEERRVGPERGPRGTTYRLAN